MAADNELPALAQRSAQQDTSLLQTIHEVGVDIKLLRPSTRIQRHVPLIDWREFLPPPIDLQWIRLPRYAHKTNENPSRRSSRPKSEPGII